MRCMWHQGTISQTMPISSIRPCRFRPVLIIVLSYPQNGFQSIQATLTWPSYEICWIVSARMGYKDNDQTCMVKEGQKRLTVLGKTGFLVGMMLCDRSEYHENMAYYKSRSKNASVNWRWTGRTLKDAPGHRLLNVVLDVWHPYYIWKTIGSGRLQSSGRRSGLTAPCERILRICMMIYVKVGAIKTAGVNVRRIKI